MNYRRKLEAIEAELIQRFIDGTDTAEDELELANVQYLMAAEWFRRGDDGTPCRSEMVEDVTR